MTAEEFLTAYPSFSETSPELIEEKIAAAALRMSASLWGDRYDKGLGLLTAHLLWIDPHGVTTRLDGDRDPKEGSRFKAEFDRMVSELGRPKFMVL